MPLYPLGSAVGEELPGLGLPGRAVAGFLQCKSSEDGDGATGRNSSLIESGRRPDPLQFTIVDYIFSGEEDGGRDG